MVTPLDPSFWLGEAAELSDEMFDLITSVIMAGASGGADLLPTDLSVLIDFDTLNDLILDFLPNYQIKVLGGITETTRKQVIDEIDEWIRSGDSFQKFLPKFTETLEQIVLNSSRAESIAVTEITRLFAEGNIMTWEATGFITGKVWRTARDERVCPICGPLEGQIVEMETQFAVPEDAKSQELARQELAGLQLAFQNPPAHVNCRCWLQPFVDDVALEQRIEQIVGLEV